MEPTRLLVAYLLLAGLSVFLVHGKNETTGVLAESITEEQRRVHQECRNSDYKQYVKCLMRPKRHHYQMDRGDMPSETDITCMTTCLSKCDHRVEQDCEKKCSHCTKRIRYKSVHQFITEIDKECESGKCVPSNNGNNEHNGRTPNITTNIDIKNVINTYNTSQIPPPSIPIIPQISLVPQITYGIGCAYSHWLCIQQTGIQIPSKPDCSACGNPVLRYKCDVNCYATDTNATTNP